MLNNLKVNYRLLLGFSLVLAMFIMFGVWLYMAMGNIAGYVTHAKNESVPFAMSAKNMEKEIIQVQQWLTDISATRGLDGLDDGFKKAEESKRAFYKDWSRFGEMYRAEGDQEKLQQMDRIRRDFDRYYETGIKMAQAFINGGPAEGNKMMGEFDQASESLQNAMAPFIEAQMAEMATSLAESDEETKHARLMALFTLMGIVLIALLFSRLISLSIVRPLEALQTTISEVESNSDFTKQAKVVGKDELAVTGLAFNQLIARVREIIQQTRISVSEIADLSENLSKTTEHTKVVTVRQSDTTAMVAAATEEVSVAISEIAEQTAASESLSVQSNHETYEALEVTRKSIAGMGAIADSIKQSADNVARLSESSGQISGIIITIQEIAEQTNLLALNAAIEAARAGEQGRGFAVVADEVRKLAERTSGSTGEISRLIESIQTEIEQVVSAMHIADRQATNNVEVAKQAEEALGKIGHNGEQINARVVEIANSTKESDIAIRDIAVQMEHIAQMTEESSAAARTTDETADRLEVVASNLRQAVEMYRI